MNVGQLFTNPAYAGLLADEDQAKLQNQALMNAGLTLLASSQGGQPGTGKVPLFPALLQGLQAGQQAYTGGAEGLLKSQELKQKRMQQQQRKQNSSELFGNGMPDLGRLKQGFAAALANDDMEYARFLGEQIKSMEPKFEKLGEGESLVNPLTKETVMSGAAKSPKFSGAYGNLAIAMFGTDKASDLKPEQLQALDAEARRRQLERPPSVSVTVGGGDNAFTKKGAELMATTFNDVVVQGRAAQRSLSQINQLDSLLEKTGGGIVPQAKSIAGNFGIPVEGLSDVQAANAIINQLVPNQRPAGSGTMSDKDVELFKQSVPRLINQPGGNKKIIQTMRNIAEYDRKMGQIASDALTGRISREEADMLMQRIPNPLSGFSAGSTAPKSNADALLKKYGIK